MQQHELFGKVRQDGTLNFVNLVILIVMKTYPVRIIFFCVLLLVQISCGESSSSSKEVRAADTVVAKTETDTVYDYPVEFKNWEMGDHSNTRLALQMYKAWDRGSISDMESLLDDTLTLELPDGRRFSGDKKKMLATLVKSRRNYNYINNDILTAYPLRNTDNKDQWVSVLVYNKWRYKDGVRDSMLYQDLWKIENGKIRHLQSLAQSPSHQGAKKLERLIKTK